MGLFKKSPKGDEQALPLIRGDGETSFLGFAGPAEWQYKKALKGREWEIPSPGGHTERFDLTIRKKGLIFCGFLDGYQLAAWGTEPCVDLIRKARTQANGDFRARAYIWKSAKDGSLGIRVYLPS